MNKSNFSLRKNVFKLWKKNLHRVYNVYIEHLFDKFMEKSNSHIKKPLDLFCKLR